MDNKDKLIEKLEEYVLLLEEELGRYTTLSLTHSWIGLASVEVIEKGDKLREEIKALKDEI